MNGTENSLETDNKVNLSIFAEDCWFTDRSKSRFWLRIYTLLGIGKEEVPKKFENAIRELCYGVPVRIRYGYLGETDWPAWTQYLVSGDTTVPQIQLKEGKAHFPGSTCVFISMPFIVDGKQIDPDKITKALSVIPSLIVAHVGKNALRDIVFDGSIEAHNGSFSPIVSVTNIPKPHDGPYLQEPLWRAIQDAVQAIETGSPEERERIELAMEIFERGIEEYSKDTRRSEAFLFYWIAMETLCGGNEKVETSLQNYYCFADRKMVQTMLGTEAIRNWRKNMVHEGKRPSVTPDVERFMQLMFADLLRYKLGLKSMGFALGFATSEGVNLLPIGLQDRSGTNDKFTLHVRNLGGEEHKP